MFTVHWDLNIANKFRNGNIKHRLKTLQYQGLNVYKNPIVYLISCFAFESLIWYFLQIDQLFFWGKCLNCLLFHFTKGKMTHCSISIPLQQIKIFFLFRSVFFEYFFSILPKSCLDIINSVHLRLYWSQSHTQKVITCESPFPVTPSLTNQCNNFIFGWILA